MHANYGIGGVNMSWFAAFMLKGIGVCVILAVAATIAGGFIDSNDQIFPQKNAVYDAMGDNIHDTK